MSNYNAEDSKDKDGTRRKDAITCSMLLQIIEESMKILWKFLRADRNEGNMILKGLLGPQIKLHDPGDAELLVDVQTTLQKVKIFNSTLTHCFMFPYYIYFLFYLV